ncbi:MAG: 50S ribosomal protein L32 [Christensenellales bacterium]
MIEPKKKVSKARRNKRHSANSFATAPTLVECSHCHEMKESHKVCPYCGYYNGKAVKAKSEESK